MTAYPQPQDRAPSNAVVIALTFLVATTAFSTDVSLPALPALAQATGRTVAEAQATIGMYILGYAVGHIPWGLLGDRFGRRPVLRIGMSAFVILGLLSAAVSDLDTLIALRFAQGIAAASGVVLARAISRDLTTGTALIRIMTWLATAMGLSMIVAPAIGTLVLEAMGWRGPFMVSALWGALGLVLMEVYVGETRGARPEQNLGAQLLAGLTAFFTTRETLVGAMAAALSFCGIMTLVGLSPRVFLEGEGATPLMFSAIFSFASVGYFVGGLLARRAAKSLSPSALCGWMGLVSLGIACVSGLSALAGGYALRMVSMFLALGAFGAMIGLSAGIAMRQMAAFAGLAAGALGTVQLSIGAGYALIMSAQGIDRFGALIALFAAVCLALALVSTLLRHVSK